MSSGPKGGCDMGLRDAANIRFRPLPHRHRLDAGLSRRRFLRGVAGVAGGAAVVGTGFLSPAFARAGTAKPRPIPGGVDIPGLGHFDIWFPGKGNEPSTITDVKGSVGVTEIMGRARGQTPRCLRRPAWSTTWICGSCRGRSWRPTGRCMKARSASSDLTSTRGQLPPTSRTRSTTSTRASRRAGCSGRSRPQTTPSPSTSTRERRTSTWRT